MLSAREYPVARSQPDSRPGKSQSALESYRLLPPTRIALLIDRLNYGGAERQYVVLAKGLQQRGHSVVAMVFYANGALESDLHAAGVPVRVLDKRGRWDVIRFFLRLLRVLRQERPRVLIGYSGVPNIFSVLLKPFIRGTRIVWGVRASNMELHRYGVLPRILARLAAALSRQADLVIANSVAGLTHVVAQGYPRAKIVVVPNGIDTARFVPSLELRWRCRREWGIKNGEKLIGLVGRLDPMKDHSTFLEAAALLAKARSDVRFVCVGDGPPEYRDALRRSSTQLGLDGLLSWVPNQEQMAEVYNALDILCSSSAYGEGFPNVLGEAMSCGVPCVVTAVGDSSTILGQPGFAVPAGDAAALAERLGALLNASPDAIAQLRSAGRERIVRNFSIPQLVLSTERALETVLSEPTR